MSIETFIQRVAQRAALIKRAAEGDDNPDGVDLEERERQLAQMQKIVDPYPRITLPEQTEPDEGIGEGGEFLTTHPGEKENLKAQLKADARRARKEKMMNGLAATGNWLKGFNSADVGAGIGTAWLVDALAGRHINSKLLRLLLGAGSGVGGMGASRAIRYGYGKARQGYDNYKRNRKVGDTPKQMQKSEEAHATDKELKEREDLVAQGLL